MMEWKTDNLENLLDTIIDYRGKTPKKTDTGIPLVTAKIIKNGIINEYSEYIAEEDYDKWMVRGFPRAGDVVLTTEAPLGEVAQLDERKIALAQRVVCLRGKQNVLDNTFLKYYFLSSRGKKILSARETGTTVTGIKQSELRKVEIVYPSIDDQKRIASILSSLDRKIETNNKINARLEEMAQAIFKDWFVDFTPFKNGKFVDSELGMIPEGWRVGTIDEFCRVFTGKKNTNQAEENGIYPFFSCAPTPLASNEYLHDGNAVIIAGNGCFTGRTSFYHGRFDLYQRTYACVAKEHEFEMNMTFIYLMMKHYFEPIKMGGTRGSSIPYIVMGDITQQTFPYSKSIVNKFSSVVSSIMDKQLTIKQENLRLASLRDTLLPKLMSGEIPF